MMSAMGIGLRWLAATLLPVALILSHRNVTIILVLIGIAGLLSLRHATVPRWSWPLLALLVWAALTCLWSPYGDATNWLGNLAALGAISVLMGAAATPMAGRALAFAAGVAILLLGFEAVTGGLIRDVVPPDNPRPDKDDVATARGITIALSLVPAVFLTLWIARRRVWGGVLGAAMAVAAFSFGIAANALAFLAMAGAAAAGFRWPRFAQRLLLAGAAAGFLLAPLIGLLLPDLETLTSLEEGPTSWRLRLVALKAVSAHLTDPVWALFTGHGVEASRILGEFLGPVSMPGVVSDINHVPTHPHNVFIQVWYDLGLIGVGLCLIALLFADRALAAAKLAGPASAALCGLMASTIAFMAFDASLWTLWRVAAPLLGGWIIAALLSQEILPNRVDR